MDKAKMNQASFNTVSEYRNTVKTFTLWFQTPDKMRTQTLSVDAESATIAVTILTTAYPDAKLIDFKASKFEPREFKFEFLDRLNRPQEISIKASSRAEAYSKLVTNIKGASKIFALDS